MSSAVKLAILHVALQPVTGPWSVMRMLAKEQKKSGLYSGVGLGVVTYDDWPVEYAEDLATFEPLAYRSTTPKTFGTGSFLLQKCIKPPIESWVKDMSVRTGASQVVVHFHNAWLSGVFVPLKVAGVKVATVATFHGVAGAAMLEKQPIRRLVHRWIAQRLVLHGTVFTSVDRDNLSKAASLFHLAPQRFHIIPNGLPDESRPPRKHPVCAGTLTIAHVGVLNSGKGWRIAAEAVLVLKQSGVNIKLLLAGNGPDEAAAKSLAHENPDCIEFLGYMCDPMKTVLPRTDLLVLMTENDGLPMAIIEALSCGVPVISTRIGGIPEAVVDMRSGRLVDRDVSSLICVLRELYEYPQTLTFLSEGALAVFRQNYEIGTIVKAYDEIYRCHATVTQEGTLSQ